MNGKIEGKWLIGETKANVKWYLRGKLIRSSARRGYFLMRVVAEDFD